MGVTQVTPGTSLSSFTISMRRSSNALHITPTASCGPVRASTPATCTGADGHELKLICKRSASSMIEAGQTPHPSRHPVMEYVLLQPSSRMSRSRIDS